MKGYEKIKKTLNLWSKADIIEEVINYVFYNDMNVKFDIELLAKMPTTLLKEIILKYAYLEDGLHMYELNDEYIAELTNETINAAVVDYNKEMKIKRDNTKEELWECEYLIWNNSKATPKKEIVIIKGNWFFSDNGKRQSVNTNGFHKIRQIQ